MPFNERREHPGVSSANETVAVCCRCIRVVLELGFVGFDLSSTLAVACGHHNIMFAVYSWMLTVLLLLLPGQGAVSTAEFVGVKLKDVLKLAGLDDPAAARDELGIEHVIFYGLDGMQASSEYSIQTNSRVLVPCSLR